MTENEFAEAVFELADRVESVLAGEDLMLSIASLTLILGAALAEDIVGKYPGFENIDVALNNLSSTIKAAYTDVKKSNLKDLQ